MPNNPPKNHIFYHRAYKKFENTTSYSWVVFFALLVPFDALIVFFHPQLLHYFILTAQNLLEWCGCLAEVGSWPLLPQGIKYVPILDMPARFPAQHVSLLNFIVSFLLVVLLPRLRVIPKPFMVWMGFVALMNLASSAFFILCPFRFPYDIPQFSLLYVGTELGIWLLVPVILAVALTPLPSGFVEKWFMVLMTLGYSIVFGVVRYVVFLYVLRKASVIYMAVMFFALGPLFDFIYIVGFYSFYVSILALRLRHDQRAWRWLF